MIQTIKSTMQGLVDGGRMMQRSCLEYGCSLKWSAKLYCLHLMGNFVSCAASGKPHMLAELIENPVMNCSPFELEAGKSCTEHLNF